mmetsp:Transcript_25736/g.47028  ORF Transcript_25736/g.47028 Transcript_25736/m.47028 type:complete len:360 (-) Transcript_25736:75-1154(-)
MATEANSLLDMQLERLFQDFVCDGYSSSSMCNVLRSRNLVCVRDLLFVPPWMLRDWLLIPEQEAERILGECTRALSVEPVTAWDLVHKHRGPAAVQRPSFLPLPTLAAMAGGLAGMFLELVGPPGAGKTQLCMHSAALAASNGCEVFWLDTEGAFSPQRVLQILVQIYAQDGRSAAASVHEELAVNALDKIRVRECRSLQDVHNVAADLARRARAGEASPGLLIVDSIAAVARNEGDAAEKRSSWVPRRQSALSSLAAAFKAFVGVASHGAAPTVMIANQVAGDPLSGRAKASLGHVWHHAVNWRLALCHFHPSQHRGSGTKELSIGSCRRTLLVEKSPCAAQLAIDYDITPGGVREAR